MSRNYNTVLFVVMLAAFTVVTQAFGTKGNEVFATIGTIIGTASGLLSLMQPLLEARRSKVAEPPAPVELPARTGRPKRQYIVIAVIAVFTVAATWVLWNLTDRTNINVTPDISAPTVRMYNNGFFTLTIPGEPPARDNLALTLVLQNPDSVGNCVKPARLELTPFVDGESRPPTTISSGNEAELSIVGATREAQILVTVKNPDAACPVTVKVQRALLYN